MVTTADRVARRTPAPPTDRRLALLVLGLTAVAPVLLVAGVLRAQAVQHPGGYDPVRQTISTLAGHGADERWVMTTTLFLLGLIYLAVAAGLRSVSPAARLVLAVGAAAIVVMSASPQPAHGSSPLHMAAMGVGCAAFALWPLALAADRGTPGPLRRRSVAATLVLTALVAWLCAQAWTDGTWLGVAERAVLLAETVWPVPVAHAAWRAGAASSSRPERTTVALSCLGLPLFLVGLAAAQEAQATQPPQGRLPSLSALASLAATDRWIMTTTLIVVGALNVLVALGLRSVPTTGRVLLGLGGAFLVVTALFPQPVRGVDPAHMVAGGLAWSGFGSWPLALVVARSTDRRLRVAAAALVGTTAVLVGWFVQQLITGGPQYGLSQRAAFVVMCLGPIAMAVHGLRRRGGGHGSHPAGPS